MITTRKKNESTILWDPVAATPGKAFTAIDCCVDAHAIYAPTDSTAFCNTPMPTPRERHDSMLKMAEKFPPDQSWFEEDFTDLRHPAR